MGRISLACAGIAISIAIAAPAQAATFSVEIVPDGAPAWQAHAIEAALATDLASTELRAPEAGKPAEIAIHGELAVTELRYAITRAGAVTRGRVALKGLDRASLAGTFRDALHRVLEPHGTIRPGPPATVDVPGPLGGALAALAALAAVLACPLVLGVIVLRQRVWKLRATRRLGLALAALAAFAYALVVHGDRADELGGAVFVAGGLAWGAFATVMLPVAWPPLFGLHRVEHGELAAALRVWLVLALQRTAWLALVLVPAGFALGAYADAIELAWPIAFAVIAPLAGLAVHLAWRGLVEVAAAWLDDLLVDGDATTRQPWHAHVRAYFVGYLRRANLDVDEHALERVRFLPGHARTGPDEHAIAVYGGGLAHTRIVIPRPMLEHALAPYGRPHDYLEPRVSTLHWTHWNQGLVMPTEPGAKLASKEERKPSANVDEGEFERIALGEPPTLAGIIEPVAYDPRTSYRPGDDPLWLDWDPGEEYDGTDAGDKDYLFGALVYSFGMQQRREDRGATIELAWKEWLAKRRPAQVLARVTAPIRDFAARHTAELGDLHAVFGGARHHVAQYVAWRLWHRDDLLTARAYVPELEARSRAILAALDADTHDYFPALRERLADLRRFLTGVRPPRSQRVRLALAFAVLAGIAGVAALIVQSVVYHGTYEEHIQADRTERAKHGKRP
jgi:hypothetical protein